MLIRSRRAVIGLSMLGFSSMLLLAGCDFWPPALQAQIEQLHSEAQQAAADKALLQNQLNAARAEALAGLSWVLYIRMKVAPVSGHESLPGCSVRIW